MNTFGNGMNNSIGMGMMGMSNSNAMMGNNAKIPAGNTMMGTNYNNTMRQISGGSNNPMSQLQNAGLSNGNTLNQPFMNNTLNNTSQQLLNVQSKPV